MASPKLDQLWRLSKAAQSREARARGAVCVDGEAMFTKQAELQSALFMKRC